MSFIRLSILLLALALAGCSRTDHMNRHHGHGEPAGASQPAGSEVSYTCPMHPQVTRSQPGKCPICGMDLTPAQR